MTITEKDLVVPTHRGPKNHALDLARANGTPDAPKHRRRPCTPVVDLGDGFSRITVQRACDGCDQPIGDATPEEIDLATAGLMLPSVVDEHGCQS